MNQSAGIHLKNDSNKSASVIKVGQKYDEDMMKIRGAIHLEWD